MCRKLPVIGSWKEDTQMERIEESISGGVGKENVDVCTIEYYTAEKKNGASPAVVWVPLEHSALRKEDRHKGHLSYDST
jgi:hypothetical protein